MRYSSRLRLLGIICMVALFASCNVAKVYEKAVVNHYNEIPEIKSQTGNIPFVINHTFGDTGYAKKMTQVKRTRTKGLFTFFYNHTHYEMETKLNYRIPLHQFINSAMIYGRSSKVTEKLKGKQVELTVEHLPRHFVYHVDEKDYLFLVNFYQFYIVPGKEDVIISYTVKENGLSTKTGKVTLVNPNAKYNLTFFQTFGGAVNDYLTLYDNYSKNLGRVVIDIILAEI